MRAKPRRAGWTRQRLAEVGAFAKRRARILLAEDNEVNQMVAQGLLGKFGLRADVVTTGAEAITALRAKDYDLVLMDVQMPEIDGMTACRRIRDGSAGVRDPRVPIVAMTAHARAEDRADCLASGMTDYLAKPIKPAELFAALELRLPAEGLGEAERRHSRDAARRDEAIAGAPVFDREECIGLLMNDASLAREIAEQAVMDLKARCLGAEAALARGDSISATRNLHSLKGLAASCACRRLSLLADLMEEEALRGDLQAVARRLPLLQRYADEATGALARFVAEV